MRIWDLRINGMANPVGFSFDHLNISWLAQDLTGEMLLTISKGDPPLYTQVLDPAKSYCTPVDFVPEPETRYEVRISCGDYVSEAAYFETGTDFDARFITPAEEISHPVLLKSFETKKEIAKARLYITGVGLYEARLNGNRVGMEFLTPYCTDYHARLQYQTYDVTAHLQRENTLEIMLGRGWYMGRFGLKHRENIFGSEFAAAAKIVIWYADGTKETLSTDESWLACRCHVVRSSIYDGEIQDDTLDTAQRFLCRYLDKTFLVVPRQSLPVVIHTQIAPTLIISPKGEQILDFGQNFSGFVSFRVSLEKGQTIRLQAGEVLQGGCFYRDNLRTARAEFVYTSDGKLREVYPHFTFYGFRYMKVEGLETVDPGDFTGNVLYSDLRQTVQISTDNAKMNRLLQNCIWGQRSNFLDIPTDCPQRDERLGWTGDAQVFSRTACYQMDCRAFYDKFLTDIAIEQKKRSGKLPVYAPAFDEAEDAYSVWGDAATIIPWNLYTFYGDKALLSKHFPIMEGYVQSIYREDKDRLYNFGFHLGDWLSQDGPSPSALKGATDEYLIASVYYYHSAKLTAQAAEVLGYAEKATFYGKLAGEIHTAILGEYFTPTGRLSIDTQTAYTICVAFDVYRDKRRLIEGLRTRLKKDSYKIKGGFVGATQLIQALIKAGLTEDAFRILYSEQFPSWLYCVNLGATTIWERWNSLNPDGTISGTEMNSLNHYSFGSVAEAFYGWIAGVRPATPGFKKATIQPKFNYRLQKLDFHFHSAAGAYTVNYHAEGNTIKLHLEIPYGAEAEVILPGERHVLPGGSYDFTFPAPVEMAHPFSVDMPLCELFGHPQSAAILKELVPTAYGFLSSSDMGLNGEPFRALASIESFASMGAKMAEIDRRLKEIQP